MTSEALKVSPHDTLWVTDAELIRRSGVPVKKARRIILSLDNDCRSGFPPKVELWGDRRYWPAVQAYFARVGGLSMDAPKSLQPERRRYAR
jgi:hypothetical protein